jgi:hypothetical protein
MQFGRVEGLCVALPPGPDGEPLVRVTIYLETSMGIDIVREIEVEPEARDGGIDLWWEADQWTQETIATMLEPRGWELLGATDPPSRDPGEVPRSSRYALRTSLWIPPPGWDEDEGEG